MVKYTKIYSGGVPIFKEDDIFTTVITLVSQETTKETTQEIFTMLNETQLKIIKLIKENP